MSPAGRNGPARRDPASRGIPLPAPRVVEPGQLVEAARELLGSGARLALVAGHHDDDIVRVVHTYLAPRRPPLELEVSVADGVDGIPSLATVSYPAGRFEREVRDLFGVTPLGHPLPRRLVRHGHWPAGYYPMRHDAPTAPAFGADEGSFPFLEVSGDEVYEIPVGPVHAGLIEPGHFRFSVVGETILRMKARLWFVHRGVEKLFEGRPPETGIELAERISGDTAVGHSLAYTLAVEQAMGIQVDLADLALRCMLLELERLHNHVADLGAIINDVGYGIVHAQAQVQRERLLRHNEHVTGHRLLRGAIGIGATDVLAMPDLALVADVAGNVAEIVDIALGNHVVLDRLTGTAVLGPADAHRIGTLGYVAKASGLALDARHDHPLHPDLPDIDPVVHSTGDVLARFLVRAAEVQQSAALVGELAAIAGPHQTTGRTARTTPDPHPPSARAAQGGPVNRGLGVVEAWRGTLIHRVEIRAGTVSRCKIIDPSFFNWPALPLALKDTIVPDFPLANKSFNQSYAGNDL